MNKTASPDISDKVGITSAVLCTIHCLVIPALFLIKGWYADSQGAPQLPVWWEAIDVVFLIISFTAVYHSAGHTPAKKIRMALWISWCVLALSIVFATQLHWLAYFASAGLVTAHFINIRRLRMQRQQHRSTLQ